MFKERGIQCWLLMGGVPKNLPTCFKTTTVNAPWTWLSVVDVRCLLPAAPYIERALNWESKALSKSHSAIRDPDSKTHV